MKQTVVWGTGRKLKEIINVFPVLLRYIDVLIDKLRAWDKICAELTEMFEHRAICQ